MTYELTYHYSLHRVSEIDEDCCMVFTTYEYTKDSVITYDTVNGVTVKRIDK